MFWRNLTSFSIRHLDKIFFDSLKEVCEYTGDDHIHVFITDNKYINATFEEEDIYPSIFISKDELDNSEKVVEFLDEIPGGDSMYRSGINICVMPPSFEWIFIINRTNELGCFLSNSINIIKLFK